MARKIDLLRQLQDLDSQLDAARLSLTQAQLELGDRRALAQREAGVERVRQQLHQIEAQQRDGELEAETHRTKIAVDEKRLYGGTVSNPKELGSLTDEIAQDKRQRDKVEDRLIELLEQSEQVSAELATLEAALARSTADWNSRQEEMSRRVQEFEATLASREASRAKVAEELDTATRSLYDQLRRQKHGTAVAQVLQRTCQACRVGLTAAIEQRARYGQDLVTCQSCGRILYVSIS
ncbi:MAG TPA: C4-type zinc ribbon domain-containing protein [Chloroflexota bacterium]